MAAVYEFPNKISSNHAITWSPDHRISFCTDTAMKIMVTLLKACVLHRFGILNMIITRFARIKIG
jgi:hypothetical protein